MRIGPDLIARVTFFVHVQLCFQEISSQISSIQYSRIKNMAADGTVAQTGSTKTRNALSCAVACYTESQRRRCTIPMYNKTSKNCIFTKASVGSMVYYNENDIVTLLPELDCATNDLPTVANGSYTANPFIPGMYSLECDTDFELSLTNAVNGILCDVNKEWLTNNITCVPKANTKFVEGREFLVAFMENYEIPDFHFHLYVISSEDNAAYKYSSLSIEAPKSSYKKTFQLTNHLDLNITSEIDVTDAIIITSSRPVTVFAMNVNDYSSGGMLVLPVQSLSKKYLVAATPYNDVSSSLLILSRENDTKVTLTFPDYTQSIVNVDRGITYQLFKSGLSGTFIESSDDIAVFAGEKCANLPDPGNYSCDHIIEQMPPLEALDTVYIVARTSPRDNYGLLILAAYNNTTVYICDIYSVAVYTAYLNKHETFYRTIGNDFPFVSVRADQPVLVTQYGVSTTVDNLGQGDGSMFVVPGTNHFLKTYRFIVPDGYNINKVMVFYNISDGNDPRHGLKHNGAVEYIAEMTSVTLGKDIFGVCYLDVVAGVHYLENSVGFGAILYGQAIYKEYAWNLGMYMWNV